MSKNAFFRTLLTAALVSLCAVLSAQTAFSSIDLGQDSELLFTARTQNSPEFSYNSLYLAELRSGSTQAAVRSPEVLTCFPEHLQVYLGGKLLEITNTAGTAFYDVNAASLSWTEGADLASAAGRDSPVQPAVTAISPDGNWKCFYEKSSAASAAVYLMDVRTGRKLLLSENEEYRTDRVPVLWSPDSALIIYEKDGTLYFLKTADTFSTAQLTEEFRIIGKGDITDVYWANSRTLVYIDYDMVYCISVNELQTRALYSEFLGLDYIAGRLPVPFDSEKDRFWTNSDGSAIVVVQNNRTLWYLELSGTGSAYEPTLISYPLLNMPEIASSFQVFWAEGTSGVETPVVWIEYLNGGVMNSYAFSYIPPAGTNGACFSPVTIPASVRSPLLSPDRTMLAFRDDRNLHVYSLSGWKQKAVFVGEDIVSYAWGTSDTLFIGGTETVRSWNLTTGKDDVLFLSSADRFGWDLDCQKILVRNTAGMFEYDSLNHVWNSSSETVTRASCTQNSRWRVFLGESRSSRYTNSLYVRTLTGLTETRPLVSETGAADGNKPKVALVFDALDNADGLITTLLALKKAGIRATFFINGEFIRRYPAAVKEIVDAGHQCASMFFTTGDLTSRTFVADESYIRRGLARNEDEFLALTGKELELYWHAPFYRTDASVLSAGGTAGYAYVERSYVTGDTVTLQDHVDEGVPYLSARQIIEDIVTNLTDGAVIPVSIGTGNGSRTDYLYDRISVLISAIEEAGYSVVTVSEL